MLRLKIKPLSVNEAWKGRRFKTDKYKSYEEILLYNFLPKIELPEPPFKVNYRFGLSSKLADIDNPVKPFQDVLQKKYGFDDKHIYVIVIERETVAKGEEFIEFKIETLTK